MKKSLLRLGNIRFSGSFLLVKSKNEIIRIDIKKIRKNNIGEYYLTNQSMKIYFKKYNRKIINNKLKILILTQNVLILKLLIHIDYPQDDWALDNSMRVL